MRLSVIDERYMGKEPVLKEDSTESQIIRAYSWYNYFYSADDAKDFVVEYLKAKKADKETIRIVGTIPSERLLNIGWNCRILSNDGFLSKEIKDSVASKLEALIKEASKPKEEDDEKVVSVHDRTASRVNDLIAELESQIDVVILKGENDFDVNEWFITQAIKPLVSKKISDYYADLYSEVFDAVQGKNEDLNYAYRRWKKPKLKNYLEFLKKIRSVADTHATVIRAPRKTKKKKEKPAIKVVSKLKFLDKFDELGLVSVKATEIVGAQQFWSFNTKYRTLSVYNASSPVGLSVKGTTVQGFDEKLSITKKLRKPKDILPNVLSATKAALKKIMSDIKGAEKEATGRINTDTILLRAIK